MNASSVHIMEDRVILNSITATSARLISIYPTDMISDEGGQD